MLQGQIYNPVEWKMEQETKMIGENMCFKATTTIEVPVRPEIRFGRRGAGQNNKDKAEEETKNVAPKTEEIIVTAWYALNIPVSHGPSDYWGLPGLILEASYGNTVILCTKIVINPKDKIELKEPTKGKEVTQAEYDEIHGTGTFAQLGIPGLRKRNRNPIEYLPATAQHPQAKEPFRAIPTPSNSELTDLGVWNILSNPDLRKPQLKLWRTLCKDVLNGNFHVWNIIRHCRPSRLLPKAIARFKTPGLRDLSHSAPYSHTGQADTLEDVIRGYIKNANLRREGELRNGDRRLKKIALIEEDIAPLTAFLKSLNEDYN